MVQVADTKEGNYYVTAQDGERHALLAGPFKNNHQAALDLVAAATKAAWESGDPKAPWYAYGTARFPLDVTRPGVLNAALGVQ